VQYLHHNHNMTAAAQAIQERINTLQNEHRDKMVEVRSSFSKRRGEVYKNRTKLIAENGGPKSFWALICRAHPEIAGSFGPYDEEIVDKLENVQVEYTDDKLKLILTFGKNEYFSDTQLWATDTYDAGDVETSGVHWKPGKGPLSEEEEAEPPTRLITKQASGSGTKRGREDRGPSIFEVFETVLPHPDDEETPDEVDEDDYEAMVNQWDEENDDRKEVLSFFVEDCYENPLRVLTEAISGGGGDDEEADE